MNPSPLRYPGGKYKLYKYVSQIVKKNNCKIYVEPFCGGAAVALKLLFDGLVNKVIINDFDYTIFCFWDSILNNTEEFIEMILKTEVTIDEWHRQKNVRDDAKSHTKLEIGFSTFFLNRTNRSGIIDKAGPIGGRKQKGNYLIDCRFNKKRLIEQIRKIASYKNQISLYNFEALKFINDIVLKKKKMFIFFDPPYYGKGPGLYTSFYTHDDHVILANTIKQKLKRRKWIITYDSVEEIKKMYMGIENFEFTLRYTLQTNRLGNEIMFLSKMVKRPCDEDELISIIKD